MAIHARCHANVEEHYWLMLMLVILWKTKTLFAIMPPNLSGLNQPPISLTLFYGNKAIEVQPMVFLIAKGLMLKNAGMGENIHQDIEQKVLNPFTALPRGSEGVTARDEYVIV